MAVDRYNAITNAPEFVTEGAPDSGFDLTAVAAFAASVGTRPIGTTAQRLAYAGKRDGLEFYDTTLGQSFIHRGPATTGAWQPHNVFQLVTAAGVTLTGPSAGILSFTHSLGATPKGALVTMTQGANETVSRVADAIVWDLSPTGGRLRVRRSDAPGEWMSGNSITAYVLLML